MARAARDEEDSFAFVHYWNLHKPYNMPERFRTTFNKANGGLITKKPADENEYVPGWEPEQFTL